MAATYLASQPAAGHSLGFIITIVIEASAEARLCDWRHKLVGEFGFHALLYRCTIDPGCTLDL